jgi:hypothetical protein
MLETAAIALGAVLIPAALVGITVYVLLSLLQWVGRSIANLFKLRDN